MTRLLCRLFGHRWRIVASYFNLDYHGHRIQTIQCQRCLRIGHQHPDTLTRKWASQKDPK